MPWLRSSVRADAGSGLTDEVYGVATGGTGCGVPGAASATTSATKPNTSQILGSPDVGTRPLERARDPRGSESAGLSPPGDRPDGHALAGVLNLRSCSLR